MKKEILCTICARKNSKGLKDKNFLQLKKKPLISHSILQAKKTKLFSKIVVSSDSKSIKNYLKKYKVDHIIERPKKYSNDNASKLEAIRHALIESEKKFKRKFDVIVDLDVTSPLRFIVDIRNALKFFFKKKCDNLVSGSISKKNPFFNQVMYKNKKLQLVSITKNNITKRQSAPKTYDLNASIYIWHRKSLLISKKVITKNTSLFKMPPSRSIDIDNKFDFELVKYVMNKNKNYY